MNSLGNKGSLQQLVECADHAYAARDQILNVRENVELLRRAFPESDNYEIAWRLSRGLFFLGQESTARGDPRGAPGELTSKNLHAEGAGAGRRATRLRPERVEGHFWAGVNLGLLASLEPGVKAAVHALRAKRMLQKAIAIDASYHGAGPLRVLARLQHKLPRWLGGGTRRARANFERAILLAPSNTVTRIYLAELLLEEENTGAARFECEQILNMPMDFDWAFEMARDRRLAKEMLRRNSGE